MIEYGQALNRLTELIASTDQRVLIGVCGAPGAGKTVLAERLTADLNRGEVVLAAHVPMDGFHLADSTLARLGRSGRKGALDTFDGWGYAALVERLRNERRDPVYAPSFDRTLEEPIAGSIEVAPEVRVVISEGNYLLIPEAPWSTARSWFTEIWFCAVPDELRMARLISRHMQFGRSETDARQWAADVDGPNAALINSLRPSADLEVSTGDAYAADALPSEPRTLKPAR